MAHYRPVVGSWPGQVARCGKEGEPVRTGGVRRGGQFKITQYGYRQRSGPEAVVPTVTRKPRQKIAAVSDVDRVIARSGRPADRHVVALTGNGCPAADGPVVTDRHPLRQLVTGGGSPTDLNRPADRCVVANHGHDRYGRCRTVRLVAIGYVQGQRAAGATGP